MNDDSTNTSGVRVFWLTNVALGKPEVQITTQYEKSFQSYDVTKTYVQCIEARASAETARQCATLSAFCVLLCLFTCGSDSDAETLRSIALAVPFALILFALFERISFSGSRLKLKNTLRKM